MEREEAGKIILDPKAHGLDVGRVALLHMYGNDYMGKSLLTKAQVRSLSSAAAWDAKEESTYNTLLELYPEARLLTMEVQAGVNGIRADLSELAWTVNDFENRRALAGLKLELAAQQEKLRTLAQEGAELVQKNAPKKVKVQVTFKDALEQSLTLARGIPNPAELDKPLDDTAELVLNALQRTLACAAVLEALSDLLHIDLGYQARRLLSEVLRDYAAHSSFKRIDAYAGGLWPKQKAKLTAIRKGLFNTPVYAPALERVQARIKPRLGESWAEAARDAGKVLGSPDWYSLPLSQWPGKALRGDWA